jgi:hypothetical protein
MNTKLHGAVLAILLTFALACADTAPTSPAGSAGTHEDPAPSTDEPAVDAGKPTGKVDAGAGTAAPAGKDGGATSPKDAGASSGGSSGGKADASSTSSGDDAGAPDAATPSSSGSSPFPQLPHVDTTDGPGPFAKVVKVKMTEPGGWLIYPEEIGKGGMKHPIFVFGPGGGTTPDTYEQMGMHWDRYGSYGFVIYVLPRSTGDGAPMKAGLEWVLKQNDDKNSPLYQKLDTSKICVAGHSQGSITTFAFLPDDRVTTSIHISGGSGQGAAKKLNRPTMFVAAPDSSGDPGKPNADKDFADSTVPTFYTVVDGGSHLTSGRLAWEAVIAWMLWHLAGQEEQWKKEFVEPTGKFHMGIYKSQIKNW